jgi:hypothetical protein
MKRLFLYLLAFSLLAPACHKSTCPTFDKANDGGTGGGGKTKSGVYPKKMK